MSIQRGTITIVVSARVGHSRKLRDRFAKLFARLAAKLTSSKIKWEVRQK